MAEMCFPDKLTPCSPADLYATLRKVWPGVNIDSQPTRPALVLLVAHWALETGFGHGCHAWNLGNKKHVQGDGHDFVMFACGEEMPLSSAQLGSARDPAHVQIVGQYEKSGQPWASVRFLPPHPATWFVSFPTLEAGASDYLVGLRGRFRSAWPFVLAGDVAGFCHALKSAGYYTADEGQYTAGVMRCYRQLDAAIPVDGAIGAQAATDELANQIAASERETQPELPDPPDAA